MGALGERMAAIEQNTKDIKDGVGRIERGLQKHEDRLDCQEKIVDRHTLYWKVVGGVLGIVVAGVTAWATGAVKILIATATAAINGTP